MDKKLDAENAKGLESSKDFAESGAVFGDTQSSTDYPKTEIHSDPPSSGVVVVIGIPLILAILAFLWWMLIRLT